MLRKLTPDELNQLEGEGYDTSGYKGELVEFPDPPKASVGAVLGRSALANALPATAGAAGFAGGMAGGAALGAQLGLAGGPFAPVTVPAVALGGGIVGGMLASAGTRKVQDMLTPQAALDRLAQDQVERPVISRAGEIGASLLTMRPSVSVTKDAIKGIAQLPAASVAGSKAINTLNPAYRSALANVGMGAGISGATDAGLQLAETGEIDPSRLAAETLIGAALNKPTPLGRKVMRLPAEAPARIVDNSESYRQTMGRVVPPAPPADAPVEAYRQSLAGQQQFNESAIALAQESIAKQEALNAELERVKQTQAELADATAAALEEARYSIETLMTPKEAEVNAAMQEQKIPRTPSKQFSEVTSDLLRSKNIEVEQSTNIPQKGVARLGGEERKVIINPEKATSDIIAHEGQHYEITEIEKAAADGDSRAKKFLSDLYGKQKESLDAYNKKLVEAGQTPVDAHEFATTEQGAEFLKQQLNLNKEGPWRKWWNDTKALWSQRFGKIPSTEDLQRALNYRFVNRTGEMGTIGKYGPLGKVGSPNMAGATVGNMPFERDAANREDYWKKRRAAAAAEREALGFPKGQELTMVTPPNRKQPLNNITEAQAKDILHYAKQSIGNVLKRVRAGTDKMPFLTEEVKGDISLDIYNEIATKGVDEDGIVPTVQRIAGRKVREYMKMKRTETGARSLDATVGEEGGQTAQDKTADTVDTNKGFTREDAIRKLEEALDTLMASDDFENPDAHEVKISAVERALEKVRKMPVGSQVDETTIFSRNSEPNRGIPRDEGFNTKEGDDVLSSNEDIDVRDLTNLTPGEKLAKNRLPFLNDDSVRVTVNNIKEIPEAGYVQVDEIHPKLGNTFSSNPESMNKIGYKMPSTKELKTLPNGQYTLKQAKEMLLSRNSEADRGIQREEGDVQPFPVDNTKKSFFRFMESTFDKVERISVPHAQAARNYEARKDQYTGLGNVALNKLSGFDRDAVNRVIAEHRRAYRDGVEPTLTGAEDQAISQTLKDYYGTIADIRRNLGIRIGGREAGKNEYYVPDMLNAETLDMFINKPTAPETMFRKNEWAQYVVDQSDGKITLAKAKEDINEYVRALNGGDNNYLSLEFGAIRRAAGYGLPESMRDPDAISALARYNRRAAADLAFFQEIQSKPEIAGPLLVKNQHGGIIPGYKDSQLPQSPLIQNMMQWITGNVSGKTHKQPKLSSIVRLVNNALLGPATGIRDLASVPVNSLPYIDRFSDLGAAWRGLMDVRKNSNDALRFAARQPSIDRVQFDEVLNAPDRFSTIVGKVADALRKYQGREYLENLSRDITFSMGKELGRNNVLAAKAGDAKAKNWLSKFSDLVEGDVTQLQGEELEAALNQIGKNFTDRNQGTYGGRGLPLGVVDSQFAPFLSLQKWSIEKSNVIYKDVYKPFITGENRLPLLTYTLGSLMTGAAIQQLNTLMSGRKASDPDVKEALAKGDAASITHELATLMQLGSHAGIMSDGLKTLADMGIRGKTPRNVVSFPTATAAVRTAESVSDMLEALRQGEDPWEVLKAFTIDTAVNNVQSARILANHTWKEEDLERSDKFRDRRIFNELEGKPTKDFTPTNPYLNMDEKKFKRTADIGKAAELAPGLVKKAIEKAEGNPLEAKKNLRSLKGNSYQTVPNPQENPVEFARYYKFLVDTQGQEEADRRIEDYVRQSALNKMKSRLIP